MTENELQKVDIAGSFEIHTREEDLEEIEVETATGQENNQAKRKRGANKKQEQKVNWRKGEFMHNNFPISKQHEIREDLVNNLAGTSPLDIFFKFFDDEVQEMIVNYSNAYAQQNNRHEFSVSKSELLNFIGILVLSGYHVLPQTDMYWSTEEDKGVQVVKQCMSRNKFRSIKQNLHFNDNTQLDKDDKYSKIRPLFDIINKKFMQFDTFSEKLAVDEEMVPYFGRHSCKMFIKGKPVRFGFKLWCLCSSDGYMFQFIPYAGASPKKVKHALGLGPQVVLELLSVLKNKNNHEVFFDNFFSSYNLFKQLKTEGFFATATIREDRTQHAPLESSKIMKKTRKRGSYDSCFDEDTYISLARWCDNSVVTLISTHYHVEPIKTAKRYNRMEKRVINVTQPFVISQYNSYMGGVDLHDNGVANYRIGIKGKKWWWPLFTNTIGNILVNSWKLYNIVNNTKMSQIDFKSNVALRLLKMNTLRASASLPGNIPTDIRRNQSSHLIFKQPTRRRCRFCHSQTVYMCRSCNVHLHPDCFEEYHLS